MADASKAEKLAAARRKLKQFQQKSKEPANNARSTPPSQKSASPIDNILNHSGENHDITDKQNSNNYFQSDQRNGGNLIHGSNFVSNGSVKQDVTTLFAFQNNSPNNNSAHFFDNLPQSAFTDTENSQHDKLKDNSILFPATLKNVDHVYPPLLNEDIPISKPVLLEQTEDPVQVSPVYNSDSADSTKADEYVVQIANLESKLFVERRNNEDLQRKLVESHGHILSLQHEIKRLNEDQNQQVAKEVLQLEDKLKFQLQTIEILVSEKSELQKELFALQEESKANSSKCDELSSRLKASRSQVQKLEKELSERTESKSQHNSILKRLETESQQKESIVQEALHNLGEARNEIRELERRIEVGLRDQEELRRQLQDKDKQFSMAQIKLAQLGGEMDGNSMKEIETLKAELEKSHKDIENAIEEKNKCETELRQYISSLNNQVVQSNTKLESAEKEKEQLTNRVDELIKHLSDLEKQLQREKNNKELPDESETVKALRQEVADGLVQLEKRVEQVQSLENQLYEFQEKLSEAERWRDNVPDMSLLQAAMESDRVAATRAVEQNNALKQKLTDLEEYILKINTSKLELTEDLDKYRHLAGDYRLQLEKYKSRQEMRWVDSVTQTNHIRKANSDTQTTVEDAISNVGPHEPVSIETLVMIEDKLKKTMDRVADLSDDKQRLEHLVLQLQSETETIGEYVTLYQNQRSLLKEKAEEKERQMVMISKEREELKVKLNAINNLLTKFPHNPEVEDTTCKISSLLGEIQSSGIVQDTVGTPPTFHPCLLCSGKLINV